MTYEWGKSPWFPNQSKEQIESYQAMLDQAVAHADDLNDKLCQWQQDVWAYEQGSTRI